MEVSILETSIPSVASGRQRRKIYHWQQGLLKQSDHNDASDVEILNVPFTVTMEIPKVSMMWSLPRAQAVDMQDSPAI